MVVLGRLVSSRMDTLNCFANVSHPGEMTLKFRGIHVTFYKRDEWLIQESNKISLVLLSRKIEFTIVVEGRSLCQFTQGVFDTRRVQEYNTFSLPELKFWEFLGYSRLPSADVSYFVCPWLTPLQFTGRTIISVQLLPNASVIWEGSHSKLLGEGMSQGKGTVSEIRDSGVYTTFCPVVRDSDLIKPLPPAQQGLLCSKCFNCCGGWGLGCSLPHHV